jgi:hypothetical protein
VTGNEARTAAATLAGPPAGGALFALARAFPFLADAATAVISLVSLGTLRLTDSPATRALAPGEAGTGAGARAAGSWRRMLADARAGFGWLFAQPFMRAGSMLYAAENATIYGVQILALLILHRHGASSAGIGFAYAIVGAGGLVSAALAGPLRRRLPARAAVLTEPWVYAAMVPLLLVLHSVVGVGLAVAVMMLPLTLSTSIIVGGRMMLTPDHLRGRVQASGSFVAVSLAWLGPLAAGQITQHAGESAAVLALAGWALATAVLATAARGFRAIPSVRENPADPAGA